MRYRPFTGGFDFSRDVAAFVSLMGGREYHRMLRSIHESLNKKGFVTEIDDLRFSLELELLNLEMLRLQEQGNFRGVPTHIHEAADFIIGLGQTIPTLSLKARTKLRSDITGYLKTTGLRPLQHEMRVAGMLSKIGCEVSFPDLEQSGGCDFFADRDGVRYEVEAKSLSVFSGQPITPEDSQKLFMEVRRHFKWSDKTTIPILNVTINGRLSVNRNELLKLVDRI